MTRDDLLNKFYNSQVLYSSGKDRKYLKDNSQFFTPLEIANKMIETIDLENFRNSGIIRILEPSAGCGILILQLVFHLIDNTDVKSLEIVAYETEIPLFTILKDNLNLLGKYIIDSTNVEMKFTVINSNFILENKEAWGNDENTGTYNIIISNPPFNKVNQTSEEAIIMKDVVYGQPNLYSLFIGMSLKLLAHDGVYSVLSPRNYLTGEYSKKIREHIFSNYALCHIHTFNDRNIFKSVNQEIIISTFKNVENQSNVKISHNGIFEFITGINDLMYDEDTYSIIIPTNNHSLLLFEKFKKLNYTLSDLGIKISVGPIVQFRNEEYLSKDTYSKDFAPLLIANDIRENNRIIYNDRINNPKRKTHNKAIHVDAKKLLPNSNYLLLRKVMAKDDKCALMASILEKSLLNHDYLGLDNNLLYFDKIDKSDTLSLNECYGLYCYINSTYFQDYYLLINSTHTINVSDFNSIKFPSLDTIRFIGNNLIDLGKFDKSSCSNILTKILFNNL